MSMSATTINELLAAGADGAAALSSPGGVALTYGNLRKLAADTRAALNAHGVGRNDRVAIVLDNGPEMAATFIAVASGTTSAPLNPGYRADEFEFYLTDLNARVLLVEQDKDSPAVEVARKLERAGRAPGDDTAEGRRKFRARVSARTDAGRAAGSRFGATQ